MIWDVESLTLFSVYFDLKVSRLYGYEEVDYPVLETEALFIRKAGEEIRDQVSLSLHFEDLYLQFYVELLEVFSSLACNLVM